MTTHVSPVQRILRIIRKGLESAERREQLIRLEERLERAAFNIAIADLGRPKVK